MPQERTAPDATQDQLELSILDSGSSARAIIVVRNGYDMAVEALGCTKLRALTVFREKLAAAASGAGERPTADQLIEFGQRLFSFIVRKKVDTIYNLLPNSHIRLHIYSNRADLQSLPWEYIQQPGALPGPDPFRCIVRIVPTINVKVPDAMELTKKVRMLFVYAEPIDQDAVAWLDIKETIEREFLSLLPESLELNVVEGGTRQALFDALDEKPYDILHFAGHGWVATNGVGHILLKDWKTGRSDPFSAVDLGRLLKSKSMRLVVLSACSTSAGDFAKEFAVVAKTLVENSVPAVVANQFPITNSVAAKFAKGFYKELLRVGDVDKAMTNGRLLLSNERSLPGDLARFEWGIPTLYRHVGAAQVFKV